MRYAFLFDNRAGHALTLPFFTRGKALRTQKSSTIGLNISVRDAIAHLAIHSSVLLQFLYVFLTSQHKNIHYNNQRGSYALERYRDMLSLTKKKAGLARLFLVIVI